jgi:hypothetical protein|tara:strand:+ start:1039 stop:1434 length:396 start_codon:yes stop_codon:yes gene_type:complete
MTENLVLNFDEWNINLTDRTRNRMKLQIKLGKDEALAFKNFMEMVKPPEIAESDFLKGIFKIGVETMETKLMEAVQQHAEEEGIDLSNSLDVEESAELDAAQEEIIVPVMGEMSSLEDKPATENTDELQAD